MRSGAELRGWIAAIVLVLGAGCARQTISTPSGLEMIPPPDPTQVESVLFLLGDPGEAVDGKSPVLQRLSQDIEYWAAALPQDATMAMFVLGDIVYPRGLHPPGDPAYDGDTAIVMSQVRMVSGPGALSRRMPAFFMAGNHDWGLRREWEGYVRLKTLDDFLSAASQATGATLSLEPPAGTGGPTVLDWGRHHRLLILDTAWWLLQGNEQAQRAVIDGIEEAFRTRGEREIILFAHHPFSSGGPHGGGFSFWETLGARYVLFRSGAILQDITSLPYRNLESGLRSIFARYGRPLAFVGGHEHSLQLIEGMQETDPRYSIVSGSGSKISAVGPLDGLVFAQSAPGYMRLVLERGGGSTLYVEATTREYLKCPDTDPGLATCMAEGAANFQTVFSRRLR